MLAEQERIERRAVVQNALASQRMEGLEPDAKVIEDAEKWARGEMSITAHSSVRSDQISGNSTTSSILRR